MNLFEKSVQHKSLYGAYVVNDHVSFTGLGNNLYIISQDKLDNKTACVYLTKQETKELIKKLQEWVEINEC